MTRLRDELDRLQQLRQPVQGQEVRLERDEDLAGRAEGVERQDAERRRAVHQDVVEVLVVGLELVAEDDLAADGADQLDLGGGQVDVAPADEEVGGDLAADLGQRHALGQHVVERRAGPARQQAEVQRGVGLRVEVEDQRPVPLGGQGGGEVDGRGRLADPALLIQHRDPSHGGSPSPAVPEIE